MKSLTFQSPSIGNEVSDDADFGPYACASGAFTETPNSLTLSSPPCRNGLSSYETTNFGSLTLKSSPVRNNLSNETVNANANTKKTTSVTSPPYRNQLSYGTNFNTTAPTGGGRTFHDKNNSPIVKSPPNRKELSEDTEFGTAAIASGAFAGAAVGTIIPVVGTAVGATVGAGFGFILGIVAQENNDNKKAGYQRLSNSEHQPLSCSDEEE